MVAEKMEEVLQDALTDYLDMIADTVDIDALRKDISGPEAESVAKMARRMFLAEVAESGDDETVEMALKAAGAPSDTKTISQMILVAHADTRSRS